MADLLSFTDNVTVDTNGDPVSGAKATFYDTGTDTVITVYTTESVDVAHPSPLVSDGEGVFPAVFHAGSGNVKCIITDASDVELPNYPMDPVVKISTTNSGAGQTSFSPTSRIPESNVQDAVEAVDAKIGDPTTAGMALVEAADTAAQRTALGLTNAATTAFSANTDFTSDPDLLALRSVIFAAFPTYAPNSAHQDMTSSRAQNTVEQNTTGYLIDVHIQASTLAGGFALQVSPDNSTWVTISSSGTQELFAQSTTVMPGHYYRYTGTFSLWVELREVTV